MGPTSERGCPMDVNLLLVVILLALVVRDHRPT
jgi:hypothetical protein